MAGSGRLGVDFWSALGTPQVKQEKSGRQWKCVPDG
jgi:hypothetical protein